MKIIQRFEKLSTIPTVQSLEPGTVFIPADENADPSAWMKTDDYEIIVRLKDGRTINLGDGDDIIDTTPVHILNATLTVE